MAIQGADRGQAPGAGTLEGTGTAPATSHFSGGTPFGQTATKQFAGTASLYTYFGSTVVILILVSLLPPNRPDSWLGSIREAGTD